MDIKVGDKIISCIGNCNKTGTVNGIETIGLEKYVRIIWCHLQKENWTNIKTVEKISDKRERIINKILK